MREYEGSAPLFERQYWEDWNERLGLVEGTIFSARSYRNWLDAQAAKENRQQNVSLAHGVHVNGGTYLDHGTGHRKVK